MRGDAARNCHRSYRIDVAHDLLGALVVSITFGRMFANGRTVQTVVATDGEARRVVAALIRRRASLPRRIGVVYHIVSRAACDAWQSFPIDLDGGTAALRRPPHEAGDA